MPDDELTSRFEGLRDRLAPLVEEPPVGAIERRGRRRQRARRAGAALAVAAVAAGAWMLVTATGRGWPGADLDQGPVAPPPTVPAPAPTPTTAPEPTRTSREPAAGPAPSSTRPPTTTVPPTTTTVRGLRILAPRAGTVVHPGQQVQMRATGCPPGGQVRFEDGTALRAGPDGGFTTTFEIPPGPTGDFFLDATCGGVTRQIELRREP
jgi:hypothetical protein